MSDIRQEWDHRQEQLGNTARAVLFKNFPASFNARLHQAHVRFLLDNLPPQATSLLDAGCGYGRTAAAIRQRYPQMDMQGVEMCEEFARAFEATIGPCFKGSVLDFRTTASYDAITIVTLLMYLEPAQRQQVLGHLWTLLRPGGRMLLIEPRLNVLTALRRKLRVRSLAPTGGDVGYFRPEEFRKLLAESMPEARLLRLVSFGMPFVGVPALHLGAVLEKAA